jgi:glucose dehydrogenase
MDHEGLEANYIAGTPFLGSSTTMYKGPGGYQGELVAWDIANAKQVWGIKEPDFPLYSGVLATGGDLVFYGTMDGWFRAVDARKGAILWQTKLASGIVGDPMTFKGADGRQYVAVYAGIGGWMGAAAFPSVSLDDPYAALGITGAMKKIKQVTGPGDLLYVFGF